MHTAADTLWFLDGLARVRGVSVELTMPCGAASPMHIQDEDENVFVLDGRLEFEVEGETVELGRGDSFVVRAGSAHAYRVMSRSGARWSAFTANGRYARFVREVGRPTGPVGHPPTPPTLTLADVIAVTAAAADHGIEIVGPPAALPLRLAA
jgi:quercetin dioxygenase-like cupin family protein